MNRLVAQSPFLRHVADILDSTGPGWTNGAVDHDADGENLWAEFVRGAQHDFPCYDFDTGNWSALPDEALTLWADDTRKVRLSSRGARHQLFEIELRSADELPELIEFVGSSDPNTLDDPDWVSQPLESLLDGLFLLIPDENSVNLLPLNAASLATLPAELVRAAGAWMSLDSERLTQLGCTNCDWATWLEQTGIRAKLPNLEPARDTDLLLPLNANLHTLATFRYERRDIFDRYAVAVMRLKKDVSMLFFADYFACAWEALDVIRKTRVDWPEMVAELLAFGVTMPARKQDQIAFAVELRTARLEHREFAATILLVREPVRHLVPFMRRRLRLFMYVHRELHKEVRKLGKKADPSQVDQPGG